MSIVDFLLQQIRHLLLYLCTYTFIGTGTSEVTPICFFARLGSLTFLSSSDSVWFLDEPIAQEQIMLNLLFLKSTHRHLIHLSRYCFKQCSRSGAASGFVCFWASPESASGSIFYFYRSGSVSPETFHQQAKKWKKSWFLLFSDFFVTFYLWGML